MLNTMYFNANGGDLEVSKTHYFVGKGIKATYPLLVKIPDMSYWFEQDHFPISRKRAQRVTFREINAIHWFPVFNFS